MFSNSRGEIKENGITTCGKGGRTEESDKNSVVTCDPTEGRKGQKGQKTHNRSAVHMDMDRQDMDEQNQGGTVQRTTARRRLHRTPGQRHSEWTQQRLWVSGQTSTLTHTHATLHAAYAGETERVWVSGTLYLDQRRQNHLSFGHSGLCEQ